MSIKVGGGGGGGGGSSTAGKELAYAQITIRYSLPNGVITPVPGLSVTFTPPAGVLYALEFFCGALDEDSGSTAGEQISAVIDMDGTATLQTAVVWQIDGGVGNFVFMKTPTQTGDGSPHTFRVLVTNLTNAADGVIVDADATTPAYIRAIGLS